MRNNRLLNGAKILIVDDEQDVVETVVELLNMCETVTASSFEEAKNLMNEQQFILAILDIMVVNGFKLLEIATEKGIIAVTLSAYAHSSKHAVESYEKGASYYIPKEKTSHIVTFLNDVLEAMEKGESPWSKWLDRMEGFSEAKLAFDIKRSNVPRHNYFDDKNGDIPFEFNSLIHMSPISRAYFPHRHSFYEIFYVEQGEGMHVIDFESYPIQPASLFFISPRQVHFWQLSQPLEGSVILFTENFLFSFAPDQSLIYDLDFFHDAVGSPQLILNRNQNRLIRQIIEEIGKEYHSKQYRYEPMLQSWLRMLFIRIQRVIKSDFQARSMNLSPIVNKFKKLVSESFSTQKSVPVYSKMLGISESYLFDVVKNATGMTPGKIINNEIALEAKRQLAYTDLTIAEICYKLNFEDPSYFSRFFRRETGMTPKVFRKHIGEKYHF